MVRQTILEIKEKNSPERFKMQNWAIVIVDTNKILEKYRTKATAVTNLARFRDIYRGLEIDIVKTKDLKGSSS